MTKKVEAFLRDRTNEELARLVDELSAAFEWVIKETRRRGMPYSLMKKDFEGEFTSLHRFMQQIMGD